MAFGTKQLVEAALYGAGDRRRFTQDTGVLSDVWSIFYENPARRAELLLEPWLDTPAFELAQIMAGEAKVDRVATRLTYNRTVAVADLTLCELVEQIIPLTGWYREATFQPITRVEVTAPVSPEPMQIWQDLTLVGDRGEERNVRRYPFPRLLGFYRIVGLIAALAGDRTSRKRAVRLLADMQAEESVAGAARRELAAIMVAGWRDSGLTLLPPGSKKIYAITRNRAATLAIQQSVRTVKGDAAQNLFSIDCSDLTWAVLDSGIDRRHPAFLRRAADENLPPAERSRVTETYDFSYLRDLLTGESWDEVPEHVRDAVVGDSAPSDAHEQVRLRRELVTRIRRAKLTDWEALRPFLRVAHDETYRPPVDTHGTHVAGILAADWAMAEGPPMMGMCPTINVIDIRVCREDGSSDEFIIMSALQFIRHLNANSDRMAVHGVNMSLSLEHDAAVYACGRTPVCEEAERTISAGIVVVAAAGNHGHRRILTEDSRPFDQYCPVSITDPGNAEGVITVGSTHRLEPHTYGVSYFSSRGPTGDGRVKPDLVAPGEKIFAPSLGDDAKRLDGTSMAAPHVSGAAAMLMARHVELKGDPQRIKRILCDTATDLGREPYFQGKGLVDVLRAIQSV